MPEIIEMRPDRRLLNNDFEKYQLYSETIPIISEISLEAEVHRQEPNNDQESLLEARLFAYHNHLFKNPYDSSCWFVDKNYVVWRLKKDDSLNQIYILHSKVPSESPMYNPSIGFTYNKFVIVSDGGHNLVLVRENNDDNVKITTLKGAQPGVILDAEFVEAECRLVVAICSIVLDKDKNKKYSRISLLSYNCSNSEAEYFESCKMEVLKVYGAVEYVKVERNGEYIHTMAQDYIEFESPKSQAKKDDTSKIQSVEEKPSKYCWTQDEDSVTLWIRIEEEYRNKVNIKVTPIELLVTFNNKILIQGRCLHRLDEELTTWKYEEDRLRIELVKYESGLMWNEVFIADREGEYLPNEALAAEIHSRLAHLCSETMEKGDQPCLGFNANQLEECDIKDKETLLQRINLNTEENTHLAMLGSCGYILYTHKMKQGQAVCLRHENDGCVWEIEECKAKDKRNNWTVNHECTFPGFGYVEASKRNKKFCVAPVNGTYVAILEHTRYIFLYERPNFDVTIGKQWLLDLGAETKPIMGAAATNRHLIVLCKNKLYRLKFYC